MGLDDDVRRGYLFGMGAALAMAQAEALEAQATYESASDNDPDKEFYLKRYGKAQLHLSYMDHVAHNAPQDLA